MFEYKDSSFYTSYFKNLQGFRVVEEFKKSEDEKEKNLYIGMIEVLGTIHPLFLRVEIPTTFPHMKLTFRTKSISGYPHLIHTGKIEYGDWFCLNTPFAETPEGQLEQEIFRLREWIEHQLREDLPATITDPKVIQALLFANTYGWENLDEMNEFRSFPVLTFVGDFASFPDNFKEKKGYLHCRESHHGTFYVVNNESISDFEMPYVLEESFPKNSDVFSDFVKLAEFYNWNEDTCKHVFPELNFNMWSLDDLVGRGIEHLDEKSALDIIESVRSILNKDDSYLPAAIIPSRGTPAQLSGDIKVATKVLPGPKALLLEELEKIFQKVKKDHQWTWSQFGDTPLDDSEIDYEYYEYLSTVVYPYKYHYFALGIKNENGIVWYVVFTNRAVAQYQKIQYDIQLRNITLRKLLLHPCKIKKSEIVLKESFYGRGQFSDNLRNRKIAIVGLGAIGSMIAESLSRSGVCISALWDNDIVEPGNICRSIYKLDDIGKSKVEALAKSLKLTNPFVKEIYKAGYWHENNVNDREYVHGSFYGEINYNNQEYAINKIKNFDIIIDCTGSNELLHFLSYAVPESQIISLCITNHANDLLCITSRDGNPFELRKAYLSRIEQDTKNFYYEGSGCYSPTFVATNSDIASLVNLAVRELNSNMEHGELLHSTIWSHDKRGVIADRLETYRLEGYDIRMTISSECIYDGEEMDEVSDGPIGMLLGSYSRDGLLIMVTHIINIFNAEATRVDAFKTSKGIIDYIGDYAYSQAEPGTYSHESLKLIADKAADKSINTCNPMLAVRNPDRTISFFLYINKKLVPFRKEK